jgi:Protein of unknown function (DUF3800)
VHLLYCDESNLEERKGDFLIYGGLVIDGKHAKNLSQEIDDIRNRAQVPKNFRLKFNPGPENLDHTDFISLKSSIIQAAVDHECKLLAYVVLHDLASSPDLARRNGINAVCYHFHCVLNRMQSHGLVLVDRFTDTDNKIDAHLRDKFSVGITGMPYSNEMRLDNIIGFHYSTIGQSHFTSLIDVIIGSLRFAINAHARKQDTNLATASTLLKMISPMLFREEGSDRVSELGFQFSPKVIKVGSYRAKYEQLKAFLSENGIETDQPITDQRQY